MLAYGWENGLGAEDAVSWIAGDGIETELENAMGGAATPGVTTGEGE